MAEQDLELADDLLRSAEEIAFYLYKDRKLRRRVYHLAATSNMHSLFFKMGGMLCSTKSSLSRFIAGEKIQSER